MRQGWHDRMTFAVGGAGVFKVPNKVATLSDQVDTFESLIVDGTISRNRVKHLVALIAIFGNDYASVCVDDGVDADMILSRT